MIIVIITQFALTVIIVVETLVGIAYEPLAGVFCVAMLVPYFAVGTRRLRDTGHGP